MSVSERWYTLFALDTGECWQFTIPTHLIISLILENYNELIKYKITY